MVTPRPTGTGPDSAAAYVFENGIASQMPTIIADEVCFARACVCAHVPAETGCVRRSAASLSRGFAQAEARWQP